MTSFESAPDPASRQLKADADNARIGSEILGCDDGTDPFVAAVRATRMPMIVTNPRLADNPVVFANDAFCRLTGYAREEILGRNCRFLQGSETDRATVARISAAVAARQSLEIDVRNHRKDGTGFWNRLLLAPVYDAAGELAYFFASQVDVTLERERLAGLETRNAALLAEVSDRLRCQEESETRMRVATQAARLGIWELNLQSMVLITSALFRQHLGRSPEAEMSFADLQAAVHPDDSARVREAVDRSAATGADYHLEHRVACDGLQPRWVEVRAQMEHGQDGRGLRLAGVSMDISARKQREARQAALAELDRQFRLLDSPAELSAAAAEILGRALRAGRAGYGTIDLTTETISIEPDWNSPGVESVAGLRHFRDFGSYIEDLRRGETVIINDAYLDARTQSSADTLKGFGAQAMINTPIFEQGALVALLYVNHPTPRIWTVEEVGFMHEVAQRTRMVIQRRRAEHAVRDLAASLENDVAARTAELMEAEAALRQSQKMEAVGQLTGGLAHDFNNLLTGVTGSLELLRVRLAQGRTDKVERYLMAAEGSAKRAAALTHRLLAFSRRQTLSPKAININHLVNGMEDLLRQTMGPAIKIEAIGSAGLWNTLVDPSQLENSLLNLCINARDAMPNGGRVTVETSNKWLDRRSSDMRDLPAGQYVTLSVSDTGSGMTPEVIAKAFDPFFTTKPIGQGTGLGLSMIYGFARQSGGQVRIYSEPDQGTMVCLYLPRHLGEAEPAETSEELGIAAPAVAGATVLIVDDEPSIRMLITDVLQELGYNTIEAQDGPAGLKVLESQVKIDLLITDVGLPGLNGRQVADAARELRAGLKVLFITGYAENAVVDHGHLEPGMHVLTKPFAMEALGSRVKELIE